MSDKQNVNMIDFIAELAMQVNGSELDWGELAIDELTAYKLMAASAIENTSLDDSIICRSVVTALLVENLMLNIKLLKASGSKKQFNVMDFIKK